MPQNNENLSSLRRSASDCGNPYSSKNRLLRHFIPRNDKKNQAGNVFVLIMLGVFLFGALMYSFTRSANQGTGNLTKQQSKIAAQEILNYARLVEGAVDRVRRNGCSESEISFENSVVAGYSNPNSPTDKSCHIFDDDGGKLSWANPPSSFYDDGASFYIGKYSFIRDSLWTGHGCDVNNKQCNDLIIMLHFLDEATCEQVNKLVGLNTTPIETNLGGNQFNGVFPNVANFIIGDEPTSASTISKNSACFLRSSNDTRVFSAVILAR